MRGISIVRRRIFSRTLRGAALLVTLAGASRVLPAADIAAGGPDFAHKCGVCHDTGGTGTQMLARRLGAQRALLAERADLPAQYVRTIVRSGLGSMPALTRVEVTDAQLDDIVAYLQRPPPPAAPGAMP
ncbi:MAG TPA: cytochrome c [Steroidobacteraceae bacterium]|nr:cytochrome c [Steroidobacteraceae bacterium]